MAERDIAIDEILIPKSRLRGIDEDHARARAVSMKEVGQLQAIVVRKTPPATKPFKPYTLVFGGHRLRGAEINKWKTIRAEIKDISDLKAIIIEIEENLSRRDLSALDRAVFLTKRRDLHVKQHGEITRGGDQSAKLALWSDELAAVADRIGFSTRTLQRADQIARNLQPTLRAQLASGNVAEAKLIKLAKMEPQRQRDIAKAVRAGTDLDDAIAETDPKPKTKKSDAQKRVSAVLSNYAALAARDRRAILQQIARDYAKDVEWALANPLDAEQA